MRGYLLSTIAGIGFATLGGAALAQQPAPQGAEQGTDIIVLGSRIPRIQTEGPAPVTTITSDDILRSGYQSVPDLLRAVTQNGGETQSQQSFAGADFTPGAQQVDLRGLGPNHTLVLVNGRRVADFPLPFNGNSNFTDISNIPVGLIERVEILSGSASAIYGSDAISGVVNFQLKEKVDGTRLDFRYGNTQHGGGQSFRLTGVTGWEKDSFHAVLGVEFLRQQPVWQYQRKRQDSTADNPTTAQPLARRTFLRADEYLYYIDPGKARCDALSALNRGSTFYAMRPGRGTFDDTDGYFCGSKESVAYGTMISDRSAVSAYGNLGFDLSDKAKFFTDVQFSWSKLKLFRDVLNWSYVAPDGNEEGTFFNPNLSPDATYSGMQLDNWSRQFTPEEMGGFGPGFTRNTSVAFSITPGIRGALGNDDQWAYELSFNHAQYRSRVVFPQVVIDKSNAFFLGQQQGYDEASGYPIFNADVNRLYTPLTPAQYQSITADSVYRPKSWLNNLSASVNNTRLFDLPAGPVGFAAVAEFGNQGYNLRPDPLALTQYYVGLIDSDGKGSRTHWGLGAEVRVPVLDMLQLSGATRYDGFNYAGNKVGRFTYNLGGEFRPAENLLFRAAYGTGFRAPDLNYVFRGPGNTHPSATDYYLCRTQESSTPITDCSLADSGIVSRRTGNPYLKPETSTSLNAGVFWQPTRNINLSADYFRVKMKGQVRDLDIDTLLRTEADCRIGQTAAGTAVDINSPSCVEAIRRVSRYAGGALQGRIQSVAVNPINIAEESTDGLDFAAHFRVPTDAAGTFTLGLNYTYVLNHTIRQYPGDPSVSKLAFDSGYDIPREKGSANLTWEYAGFSTTLSGQRLGQLPNYDQKAYIRSSYLFNLSARYDITDRLRLTGTINNLFDTAPVKDKTYGSYPYYDISWFDGVGRSFFLQLTYTLGNERP